MKRTDGFVYVKIFEAFFSLELHPKQEIQYRFRCTRFRWTGKIPVDRIPVDRIPVDRKIPVSGPGSDMVTL